VQDNRWILLLFTADANCMLRVLFFRFYVLWGIMI
jgi:hypothetical protein